MLFQKLFGKRGVHTPPPGPSLAAERLRTHAAMHGQQTQNLIQVPDISRKLVTRYGLREKAPAPSIAAEVVPVILVDDLVGESDLITPRIRPAAGQVENTAAAAIWLGGLVNPAGSGVIIHLYYFLIASTATAALDIHFTGTPGAGITGVSGFRNGLLPAQSPAGVMQSHTTGVSPGGSIEMKIRVGSSLFTVFPFDCVLAEGQGIQARTPAAFTGTMSISAVWSEEDRN